MAFIDRLPLDAADRAVAAWGVVAVVGGAGALVSVAAVLGLAWRTFAAVAGLGGCG